MGKRALLIPDNYKESEVYIWAKSRGIDDECIVCALLAFERYGRPSYRLIAEEVEEGLIKYRGLAVPEDEDEQEEFYIGLASEIASVLNREELFSRYQDEDNTIYLVPNWRFLRGFCERNEYWRKSDAGRKGGRPAKAERKQTESRAKAD